jgi:hypothetical protein
MPKFKQEKRVNFPQTLIFQGLQTQKTDNFFLSKNARYAKACLKILKARNFE